MARATFAEGYLYTVTRTEGSNEGDNRGFRGNDLPPVYDVDWIDDIEPNGFVVISDYSSDTLDFDVVDGWKMERMDVPEIGHVWRDDAGYSVLIRREKGGEVEIVSYY